MISLSLVRTLPAPLHKRLDTDRTERLTISISPPHTNDSTHTNPHPTPAGSGCEALITVRGGGALVNLSS